MFFVIMAGGRESVGLPSSSRLPYFERKEFIFSRRFYSSIGFFFLVEESFVSFVICSTDLSFFGFLSVNGPVTSTINPGSPVPIGTG